MEKVTENGQDQNLIHTLPVEKPVGDLSMKKTFTIFILVIIAGVASGFAINYVLGAQGKGSGKEASQNELENAKVIETAGISDKKTFKDSAEGVLREGGHKSGEGNFHLDRPGGEDQNAYLTSSTVDLSEYVGKKVRVHGETFASQNVGWLMDVGYVEVLK
ncbi:hypothetical protein A3D06_01075 [Candidatus Roizmanbacteria bacterium RIFCSPHIGHO2_02_FULL_40_9]|uniref:Uncharacterized protein n=2 Tax=Candidatus Roizmaniibacteriota TaxID=1752723 RepID=A0A1F7IPN5_9BACT|nr:MAG: hypothetical protein A3D06_01075 [Candidatus Roizmanbacteria bacterium RIFCSPHIGHO2_02_FULL_40_9]OGK45328.1 MAG: hypothetical protein A2957_02355 [Candidatus Roizmanbacteria bacterium RIFCSPLOWO2_01_FULL_38_11]